MKRILSLFLTISFVASALQGCFNYETMDPYKEFTTELVVTLTYPQGYSENAREGVEVIVENSKNLGQYFGTTDSQGKAVITVPMGIYRIAVSDYTKDAIFNGSTDKVVVNSKDGARIALPLTYSKPGTLVIKEVYAGGCMKYPQEGTYQLDKYIIIHNNHSQTLYLDGLCLGTLSPYNSNSTNPWINTDPVTGETIYQDFAPIIQAIWQFKGSGEDFPLEPGEDAVVCLNGAIDHAAQYPQSVNLNKEGYFVCYNNLYFPNTTYHPVPGDKIAQDHILDVVIKTGKANAYAISVNSPTVVIFRAEGTTIQEHVKKADSIVPTPGSTENVVAIPWSWIEDAVEIFNGQASANTKRLSPVVDAGYVIQTDVETGCSLHRHIDQEETAKKGYEVLKDTNNSSVDFYEREKQSLHE